MQKKLLILIFFIVTLLSVSFVFSQEQVINKTALPDDIVTKKIMFIDSARKVNNFNKQKEQQDNIYFKSLAEQGYSRQYIDSLHKAADPNFVAPVWYPPADETGFEHPIMNRKLQAIATAQPYPVSAVPNVGINNAKQAEHNSHSIYKNYGIPPSELTTGPEQDCISGIPVCQSSYTQPNSYTGYGSVQEVYNTCLKAKEQCSVWYIFTIQPGGTIFDFTINTTHDYDWAIYDLTAIGGCSYVPTSAPVSCNFSGTYGNTGISTAMGGFSNNTPASGIPWNADLTVTIGHTYAMVIDNYSLDAVGYTLTFGGSAVIVDNTPPTLSAIKNNCDGTVTITTSEQVKCSSIASNGSDFTITGPGAPTITTAAGISCPSLTNQIKLTLGGTLSSGTYTIGIKVGSDGNTLLDKCANNPMSTAQTITFNYLGAVTASASPALVCTGGTSNLTATNIAGVTYAWTPTSGLSSSTIYNPVATPNATTSYQCSITYGGCTSVATTAVTVAPGPVVNISPMNAVLCSGTQVLTATTTGGTGPYTYSWTGGYVGAGTGTGTTNTTPALGAGTYNVTVSASGCASSSATSVISLASSPPANTCNIYYATPSGAGTADGTSIANAASPATLPTVLGNVMCNGATIKMAVGVYTFSSNTALSLTSNTTLEGGYDATFSVKYSQDGTAAHTTVIRRDNTNPVANQIIGFNVAASSSNFRLQDLRIELPGATNLAGNPANTVNAAGSQINNYAIYLGAGCTNYNIVRGHVDAGIGGTGAVGIVTKTYSGANQTWSVPAGVNSINVKLWGAGGGGDWYDASHLNSGGSGGYVAGTLAVTPLSTINIIVGQGGYWTGTGSTYGGGGGSRYSYNSSGGGRSAIQITAGTDDVTAGGGGGAADSPWNTGGFGSNGVAFGGAGGGTTAGSSNPTWSISAAGGGTQVAGGAAATGSSGNGSNGTQYQGGLGSAAANNGSGGGGGGYYGGGSGGVAFDGSGWESNGGGGGSSYLGTMTGTTNLIGNTNSTGAGAPAPNNADPNYVAGVGVGGVGSTIVGNTYGGNGLVVISYSNNAGSAYGVYANSAISTVTDCEISATAGGAGGVGYRVCNPADVSASYPNVAISSFSLISETNVSCTAVNTNFTSPGVAAWNFGTGAAPATSGAQNPTNVTYSSTGFKTIQYGGNNYTGFLNIITTAPSAGSIVGSLSAGCPGTYFFSSSLGSTPGFTFAWSVPAVGGITAGIATPNGSSTNITFTNSNATSTVVQVQLVVTSQCCGVLATLTFNFTVDTYPATPTASASPGTICPGKCDTVIATAPANCSFEWYNAAAAGTLLYSGAKYMVCPASTTTYYVQSIGPSGCISTSRTPVVVTVIPTTPPTANNVSSCSSGQTMTVNAPVAGATYNWYSSSCSGLLGSGLGYTSNAAVTTTYYVTVTLPGCNESSCSPVTMTITGSPLSVVWNGTHSGGANNWFDNLNWTPNCLPVCATDVSIPTGYTFQPDIGFSPGAPPNPAACHSFSLAATTTLNFSDDKAELDVCGNFTQNGTISSSSPNGNEKVVFMGTSAQFFAKTSTGAGTFKNVTLNNTASPPMLTIMGASGSQDLLVKNNFMFQNGIVYTEGVRKLVIDNSSGTALSGYGISGYVFGRLTRKVANNTSYDFPVGNTPVGATVNPYELMNINIHNAATNYLTVSFENPTNSNVSGSNGLAVAELNSSWTTLIDNGGSNTGTGGVYGGTWTVFPDASSNTIYESGTSGAGFTYDMTLYGTNYSNAGAIQHTILKRSTSCPNPWSVTNDGSYATSSVAGNVITATRTNLSGFSQFALAKNVTPMPIDLVAFDATCVNHSTLLSWITATETNNNYFTLERSCDENFFNYQTIATILGAGNSSTIKQYSFTDNDAPGACYYRLSQTDYNGISKQFSPISINCKENSDFNFVGALPNPADNELNLIYSDAQNESIYLSITDMLGQPIMTNNFKSEPGLNKITLDLSEYSSGIYVVKLYNDNKTFVKKIVKNK